MKKRLLLPLLFLSFTLISQTSSLKKSPALSEADPSEVGMSPERLSRIDELLENAIEENLLPGAVALIARDGKIIYHKAFGEADVPGNRGLQKDDIFRIASQTKAITSTAVMMLWEEGKFSLDDPISRYIPEFKNPKVLTSFRYTDTTYRAEAAKREITIRHLLTHTSGIGYGVIDGDERFKMIYEKAGITDLFTTEPITIEESVKKLAQLPLHHHPGDEWVYSEGLDVLGYFIEVVSGMPFDEFLQKRLFGPLGMKDTYFYLPEEKAGRLVKVQTKRDGQWTHWPVTFYDPDYPIKGAKTFFSGGAGLSSTAKDYATFLQMYLNGGELNGVRILSPHTVATIMANQIGDIWAGRDNHQGLAFGVLNEKAIATGGKGSSGTFEWGGYFNTQYFADPQEKIIGILMKQTQAVGEPTANLFRRFIFTSIEK
jgi:CubicO group peptidase (beta-lactamase class C family)